MTFEATLTENVDDFLQSLVQAIQNSEDNPLTAKVYGTFDKGSLVIELDSSLLNEAAFEWLRKRRIK